MSVNMKGGTSGNRGNYIVSMPSPVPQPVLNTAASNSNSNVHFVALDKKGPHKAQQATPDFMPGCGKMPESGPDIADPKA